VEIGLVRQAELLPLRQAGELDAKKNILTPGDNGIALREEVPSIRCKPGNCFLFCEMFVIPTIVALLLICIVKWGFCCIYCK
jgi:hypothetical protein